MSFRSNVSSILKALITLHKLLSSLQNFSSSLPCNCTYSNLYILINFLITSNDSSTKTATYFFSIEIIG